MSYYYIMELKDTFSSITTMVNDNIMSLNTNKLFAGIIMITLNIGSKFIPITFSKSAEEYLKSTISKTVLVFAMAWLGTRDIYTAIVLASIFIILSDYWFNEESKYCIVPQQYRILNKLVDTNHDGIISDEEINSAIVILEKARKTRKKYNDFVSTK